ncbi:hypothetical protein EVG20_g3168 [Dentipellis fragilis]|uniref:Uncharacterized protein n=1 Tax=Dentipellis fragilis TaxID=205917 RepID=A0A4Y9Z3N3_9AGAM|nr:hypothetical protein EVG20_g3168 [Dentipellis fragilis]
MSATTVAHPVNSSFPPKLSESTLRTALLTRLRTLSTTPFLLKDRDRQSNEPISSTQLSSREIFPGDPSRTSNLPTSILPSNTDRGDHDYRGARDTTPGETSETRMHGDAVPDEAGPCLLPSSPSSSADFKLSSPGLCQSGSPPSSPPTLHLGQTECEIDNDVFLTSANEENGAYTSSNTTQSFDMVVKHSPDSQDGPAMNSGRFDLGSTELSDHSEGADDSVSTFTATAPASAPLVQHLASEYDSELASVSFPSGDLGNPTVVARQDMSQPDCPNKSPVSSQASAVRHDLAPDDQAHADVDVSTTTPSLVTYDLASALPTALSPKRVVEGTSLDSVMQTPELDLSDAVEPNMQSSESTKMSVEPESAAQSPPLFTSSPPRSSPLPASSALGSPSATPFPVVLPVTSMSDDPSRTSSLAPSVFAATKNQVDGELENEGFNLISPPSSPLRIQSSPGPLAFHDEASDSTPELCLGKRRRSLEDENEAHTSGAQSIVHTPLKRLRKDDIYSSPPRPIARTEAHDPCLPEVISQEARDSIPFSIKLQGNFDPHSQDTLRALDEAPFCRPRRYRLWSADSPSSGGRSRSKRDDDENKLEVLSKKWRESGREAAYELWSIVKEAAETGGGKNDGAWASGWGWDDDQKVKVEEDSEQVGEGASAANYGEDVEKENEVEETIGVMLRRLGIAPETLGWDDKQENFVDD